MKITRILQNYTFVSSDRYSFQVDQTNFFNVHIYASIHSLIEYGLMLISIFKIGFIVLFLKIRFARTCYKSGVTSWILQCGFPSCAPNLWSPLLQCPSGAPICISRAGVGPAQQIGGNIQTFWQILNRSLCFETSKTSSTFLL